MQKNAYRRNNQVYKDHQKRVKGAIAFDGGVTLLLASRVIGENQATFFAPVLLFERRVVEGCIY